MKLVEDANEEMKRKEKVKSDGVKDNKLDIMMTHSEGHKKDDVFDNLEEK